MNLERRTATVHTLKTEARANSRQIFRGHAAVFGQRSENLGGFYEIIQAGSFADAIRRDDVRALLNHDSNIVLGRNKAGTLTLSEDARGLLAEIDPPDTQAARDLLVSVGRGDITQMSFGFTVAPGGDSWSKDSAGAYTRTITKARLFDVSVVTFPAYTNTDVAVALRSLEAFKRKNGGVSPHWRLALLRRRLDLDLPAAVTLKPR